MRLRKGTTKWTTALMLCLCAGWLVAQDHTPEREKNPFAGNAAAIEKGKQLYDQVCQGCHGGEGRGGERAPALNGALRRGKADGEIFLNIRGGVAGTQMPPFSRMSTEQVWQLVSYIRSLSGPSGASEPAAVAATAGVALGEELFFGKAACASCHEINGRGAAIGPDLSGAGAMTADALRRKILEPGVVADPAVRGPRGRQRARNVLVVKTRDGKELRGLKRAEDTYSLLMIDTTGKLHSLDKSQLADVREEAATLMPSDYGTRLSGPELQNLLAFLQSCRGRDLTKAAAAEISGGLSYDRIRRAQSEPQNWLTYWGDYQGRHYSALDQIGVANVAQLQARWAVQMPGDTLLESTPIVVDGVMYTSGMPGQVFALDARTGLQIWKYERKQKIVNPYETNRFNRGVAVLGNRVFFGTLDAALIALDARTGLPLWEVQVADTMAGYSITAAPLAVKDKILIGVAGGEYGIRGFVDAYDAATGKRAWRFYTVPGPGEFGNDTWLGDSWKRGGAPTWLTGSYDPELNLIYWAVGNPGPDMDAEIRKGDNLFSDSVLALDADTGKRVWHYQFTPSDSHDWDATEDFVLVDRPVQGKMRKLLLQANRNGFFYVLDRTDGAFLKGTPYVRQTWNAGFDAKGRPIFTANAHSTLEGQPVAPALIGGTNFQAPSFDPKTGWLYVVYTDTTNRYVRSVSDYEPGKPYWGGRTLPGGDASIAGVKAIDTETGATKWDHRLSQGSLSAGVLATAGGVLFVATREGNLIALDAATGKARWRFQTGGSIAASPISYAVNGKQYVAIAAGGVLYTFALPEPMM